MEQKTKVNDRILELLSEGYPGEKIPPILKKEGYSPWGRKFVFNKISQEKKKLSARTLFQLGERLQNEKWAQKAGEMVELAFNDGKEEGTREGINNGMYRGIEKCKAENKKARIFTGFVVSVFWIVVFLIIGVAKSSAQTKDEVYFRAAVDPNQLFGIIDNPRTETETFGLDFDLEAGARYKRVGVYITYGRFENIGYQNYAGGVDYLIPIIKKVETSLGFNYGVVMRRDDNYYISEFDPIDEPVWSGSSALAFRGVTKLPIIKNKLSIPLVLQYQQRPDIGTWVLEGSIGLEFIIARG